MKVTSSAIGNVACAVMHENLNSFSSTSKIDQQTFDEMRFAIEIKEALQRGDKEIRIKVIYP